MTDHDTPPAGNVTSTGPVDVNDPAFEKALRAAHAATVKATLERIERQNHPGFFVAPKNTRPPQ